MANINLSKNGKETCETFFKIPSVTNKSSAEACSEYNQTSKMELFLKKVKY